MYSEGAKLRIDHDHRVTHELEKCKQGNWIERWTMIGA
jgi:hypothetical protein